jgi:phosphoribosyl 1,2-cyclic phosphodiesterase
VLVTLLGSGSRGNATLVEAGGSRVLVDAGISPKAVLERAERVGIDVRSIDGIVVTHAHGDHGGHAEPCSLHFDAPLFITRSTHRGLTLRERVRTRIIGPRASFRVGAIDVHPVPLPHDAPQVGLVLEHDGRRVAIASDFGSVTDELVKAFSGCGAVLIESNYEPDLLRIGPYPPSIRARVSSPRGHLANEQASELVAKLKKSAREVVLIHLSEANNSPNVARRYAEKALEGSSARLRVAPPEDPLSLEVPRVAHQMRLPFEA